LSARHKPLILFHAGGTKGEKKPAKFDPRMNVKIIIPNTGFDGRKEAQDTQYDEIGRRRRAMSDRNFVEKRTKETEGTGRIKGIFEHPARLLDAARSGRDNQM
jgi:hypothetical protein